MQRLEEKELRLTSELDSAYSSTFSSLTVEVATGDDESRVISRKFPDINEASFKALSVEEPAVTSALLKAAQQGDQSVWLASNETRTGQSSSATEYPPSASQPRLSSPLRDAEEARSPLPLLLPRPRLKRSEAPSATTAPGSTRRATRGASSSSPDLNRSTSDFIARPRATSRGDA